MRSSVSTRRNPLPSSPKKTQCRKSLPKKDQNKTRIPVRSNQRSSSRPESRQPDEKQDLNTSATDRGPSYTDYWPSSDWECPAGSSTSPHKRRESQVSSAQETDQQDSVLAKYVERFRHGRPQSREQRQQMASAAAAEEPESFWWLSSSSLPSSSTQTKTTDKHIFPPEDDEDDDDDNHAIFTAAAQHRHDRSLSPCGALLGGLSDTSRGDFDDTEIQHLLRGVCLSEGSTTVSSEGLGSYDLSPPVTVDEPVQRPFIPSLMKQTTGEEKLTSVHFASSQRSIIHPFSAPIRPEEDILAQWRSWRQMEQARDWIQTHQPSSSSLSRPSPGSFLPPGGGQAYEQPQSAQPLHLSHPQVTPPHPEISKTHIPNPHPADPPNFPTSVASDPSIPQVPAHMHLLCDILPCPVVQNPRSGQNLSQTIDAPESNVHKKTQMEDKSVNTLPGELVPSLHFAPSGAAEEDMQENQTVPVRIKQRKPETKESKRAATSSTQQKKSASRSSSHRKLSKRDAPLKEGIQEIPSGSCSDGRKPPPSPIRSALGKVGASK